MPRVAVIDDTVEILNLIENALMRSSEFSAIEKFSDPGKGLREVERGRFDIVLVDIEMPGANGLTVLKKIRESKRLTNVKVFIMTGHSTVDRVLRASQLKADGYIRKPFKNVLQLSDYILNK